MRQRDTVLIELFLLAFTFCASPPTAAADKSGVKPTSISLPSGPGSIEGLGESFEPQLNSGSFSYRIPLKLPSVRGGAPALMLEYSSGLGNSFLGMGWQLKLPCVRRQTDKGLPRYEPSDLFIDENAEELVALADGSYRQKIESSFIRYERTGGAWLARLRNGVVLRFGEHPDSRLNWFTNGTYAWMVSSAEDRNGNRTEYRYFQDAQQIYPEEIRYGLHTTSPSQFFRVAFIYDTNRSDAFVDCRPRFASTNRLRLNSVTAFFGERRIRHWRLQYHTNASVSLLASVTMFGDDRSRTNELAEVNHDFLPPTFFDYTRAEISVDWRMVTNRLGFSLDFNAGEAEFVDLNHDSLPDILLYETGEGAFYSTLNPGGDRNWPQFTRFTSTVFNPPLNLPTTRLVDLAGDGRSKLLVKDDGGDGLAFYFRDFRTATELGTDVDFRFAGNFPLDDPNVQFVDVNGDKSMDLMAADGNAFAFMINGQSNGRGEQNWLLPNPPPPPAGLDIRFTERWQLADMNGDRLLDLVRPGQVNIGSDVCLNLGWGNFAPSVVMAGGPTQAEVSDAQRARLQLVDIDQDGLADLVFVDSGILRLWLNQNGRAWRPPVVITGSSIPEVNADDVAIRFADMNGNGSTDIVWMDRTRLDLRYLELSPGGKAWLMNRVTTTMGRTVEIAYRSSTDFMLAAANATNQWTSVAPFPIPVVAQIAEGDGLGNRYTNKFTYRNACYDGLEREFRGFEQAMKREIGDESQGAPTLVSRFAFDTGATSEALKGKPLFVETATESGGVLNRQTNEWTTRLLQLPLNPAETRSLTFAFQRRSVSQLVELGSEQDSITLEEEFDYDNFGNPIRHANYGRVENGNRFVGNDERVVVRQFSSAFPTGTNMWILDHLVREEVQDENGNVVSRGEFFYDDETFAGNNLGSVSSGNLTLKREWFDAANVSAFINSSRTKYDVFGNPRVICDPLGSTSGGAVDFTKGHAREIGYDSELHTFPVTETIHIGNGSPPLLFQASYDKGLGTVTESTDFNANTTSYSHDTFGRLINIIRPGDTPAFPTVEYEYTLAVPMAPTGVMNFVETRQLDKLPGTVGGKRDHYFISRKYVDGLGRARMMKSEAEPAPGGIAPRVVVTEAVQFNTRRQVARSLNPFFSLQGATLDDLLQFENIEAPGWQGQFHKEGNLVSLDLANSHATRTSYDTTLRPTQITNPDGTFRRTVYEPLRTRSFDENDTDTSSPHLDTPMVHFNDGLGRLVRVDEITRLNDDGTLSGNTNIWSTRYEYDVNDQLTRITDSQNNVKTFAYDGLKRKTGMNDPDRGVMQFVFDDASNLIETTDAKVQRITYRYDGANRILTEDYHDEGQPLSANFAYDPAQPITRTNRPDVAYFYDTPVPNLDQGDTTTATARNTVGALAAVWDLSGEEHTSYDARGRIEWTVKRIPDALLQDSSTPSTRLVSYKTAFQYDSLDRLTRLIYPDADQLAYEYNDRSLLKRILGGRLGAQPLAGSIITNLVYQPSGQHGQIDYGNGVRTTYAYDPRLRLKNLLTVSHPSTLNQQLINFGYDFDGASNIKSIQDGRPASAVPDGDPRRNTQDFRYDDLYRLTHARYSFAVHGAGARNDGEIGYRYDRIGNMLAQSSTITNTDHGLPVANLGDMDSGGAIGRWNRTGRAANDPPGPHALTAIHNPQFTTRNYPYDANGNMTNIDGLVCTWDFKDRLVAVENAEMSASYTYDYTDRRITKRVQWRPGSPDPDARESTVENPQLRTVTYVNKHFEVREHDAPTKYVWNGNTRVARVTGSLNTNTRVQRLRLLPGWNLRSLAVSGSALPFGGGSAITAAVRWNSATRVWLAVAVGEILPAGTVLWIKAATNATLAITGNYSEPLNQAAAAGGDFHANAGLEVWNLKSAISNIPSAGAWTYDASFNQWVSGLPPPIVFQSDLPAVIAPGEAVFVRADTPAQLEVPDSALRIRYYHQDHLRSSTCMSDSLGVIAEETAFYPFGEQRGHYERRRSPEFYQFTQKETDIETSWTYFGARFLVEGRWLSADPELMVSGTEYHTVPNNLNPYALAWQNPLKYQDPNGRWVDTVLDVGFLIDDFRDIAATRDRGERVSPWQVATVIADGVGAILPGATGLGLSVRGVEKARKVAGYAGDIADVGASVSESMEHGDSFAASFTSAIKDKAISVGFAAGYSSAFRAGRRAEVKNHGGDLRHSWYGINRETKHVKRFNELMVDWGLGMRQDEQISHQLHKSSSDALNFSPTSPNTIGRDIPSIITSPLQPGANTYELLR